MNCRDVRALLATYLDGEVSSYERTLVEAHLAECQACEGEVSQLRITRHRVQREIKTWAASAIPPPSGWEGLMAKITADKESLAQSVTVANPSSKPVNNRFWRLIRLVIAKLLKLNEIL